MTDQRYASWITDYISRQRGNIVGMCRIACEDMRNEFPELVLTAGFVVPGGEHFWLTAPDGSVVDPTALQFTRIEEYRPFKPGDEVQVGRCMNCGWEIYRSVQTLDGPRLSVCSDECNDELIKEYNR